MGASENRGGTLNNIGNELSFYVALLLSGPVQARKHKPYIHRIRPVPKTLKPKPETHRNSDSRAIPLTLNPKT